MMGGGLMSIWRYTAVPVASTGGGTARTGEIAGDSAAAVRQALRAVGLQVVELRPLARRRAPFGMSGAQFWQGHLRKRRRSPRAEIFDGAATMLDAGMPLLEAFDTVLRTVSRRRANLRAMLAELREGVRSGASLAQAMGEHPSWFDPAEIAMVGSGEHGGNLSGVLHALAEGHERSGELAQRWIGALSYPAIVACVGFWVVIFLSTKTLPDIVGILRDADVEIPALTASVMAFGQGLASHWVLALLVALLLLACAAFVPHLVASYGREGPAWLGRLHPRVSRRMAIAGLCSRLADLVRSGVPLVEGLRVLAPTVSSPLFRRRILEAVAELEQGGDLSSALSDEHWFDPEFARLLGLAQASGELDPMLERIAKRYERQSRRLIDRMTTLLEPLVILVLAALVGTVVLAAVLPMIRLQEVIR